MIPGTGNLPATLRGTTWEGIPSLTVNPVTQTAVAAKMQLVSGAGKVEKEFSTYDDSILIVKANGPTWEFSVPKVLLDIPAGIYVFDFIVKTDDGDILPYIRGRLPVEQNVTNV
jgi:hypothetical protein